MDETERDLILKAREGDGAAFARLVSRYDRRILGLALDMVGDAEDARDVFQEAMLAAYRGLGKFRMESEFSTWLYRIAINRALTFRNQRRRRFAPEASEVEVADGFGPERKVLDAELRAQLDRALEELSAKERTAFVLCHRQGVKINRAAELMDCSAGTVKSYLFRGRKKVKRLLQDYMER
ncbi:MAG: sigma-70 family RNA polymerase sigma factor [Gemmatimonadetes bacterium]|jgi:RNA polymerase sigma-70 factor, ECF subfamily|nr:sigma-70 family RNA polymerase sigma factor [Gemmatimonadota bacterium]